MDIESKYGYRKDQHYQRYRQQARLAQTIARYQKYDSTFYGVVQQEYMLAVEAIHHSTRPEAPKDRNEGNNPVHQVELRRHTLLGKVPGYREHGKPLGKAGDTVGCKKQGQRSLIICWFCKYRFSHKIQ